MYVCVLRKGFVPPAVCTACPRCFCDQIRAPGEGGRWGHLMRSGRADGDTRPRNRHARESTPVSCVCACACVRVCVLCVNQANVCIVSMHVCIRNVHTFTRLMCVSNLPNACIVLMDVRNSSKRVWFDLHHGTDGGQVIAVQSHPQGSYGTHSTEQGGRGIRLV